MIPEKLVIQGFQSYLDRTVVHFTPGVNAIFGMVQDGNPADSNGAGKSALCPNALTWILWGQVPSGERASDLMHWEAQQVYGELTLRGRGGHLKIERVKPRNGSESVKFTWNGQEFHLDLKPAQAKLEEIYGISWEVFCNAVVIDGNSKATQFVSATPGQRAKLLSEMVPYDELFREAGAHVQKDITRMEQEVRLQQGVMERMAGELGRAQASLARVMEALSGENFRLQQMKAQREKKIAEMEEELSRCKILLMEPAPESVAVLQARKSAALQQQSEAQFRIGKAQAVLQSDVPAANTTCPTCHQVVTKEAALHLRTEREQAQRLLGDAQKASREALGAIEAADRDIQSTLSRVQARRAAESRILDLEADIKSLRFMEDPTSMTALNREREAQDQLIHSLKTDISQKEAEIQGMQTQIPVLRRLAKGFQQDLPNMLLDDIRSILAYYAEKYRWMIYGDAMTVEFPPTTATGREKFEIVLKTGEFQNKLPSKGQKYRMALAIILALRRVLIYGNRTPFEFLVMDDPVGELDDTGLAHLYKLMESIGEEIPCVITTAPRRVGGITFSNEIWTEYRNRRSRIMEGGPL